jgi:quercetin dioxygenase-like cupin family protein
MNDVQSRPLAAYKRAANLDTTMFYMGSLMSFLAISGDTGGRFALMEYQAQPGNEPPPHSHDWENEACYVLEGVMEMYCDGKVLLVNPGQFAFIPQGMPHAFYIRSANFRMLILSQATGQHDVGLDSYFTSMATPAERMQLPKDAITYQMADPAEAVRIAAEHGIHILSPDESATALPHYPGFGVARELMPARPDTAAILAG